MVEILVICLAVLYLFAALSGFIGALLQFPLFFLGHVFRGASASAVSLLLAAISLWLGIGLLRHIKAALVTAIIFNALGLVQSAMLLTPVFRARIMDCQLEIARRLAPFSIAPMPPPTQFMQGPLYFFSAVLGLLVVVAVFWLLLRAMPLFEPKASG